MTTQINKYNARDNDHDRRPGSVHRFRRSKFGHRDFVDDRVRDRIGWIRRWLDELHSCRPIRYVGLDWVEHTWLQCCV